MIPFLPPLSTSFPGLLLPPDFSSPFFIASAAQCLVARCPADIYIFAGLSPIPENYRSECNIISDHKDRRLHQRCVDLLFFNKHFIHATFRNTF
ncbi:hypothetical protein PUN28_013151 [Cardiocondyla obscurior]|uniref:Uncharacterized protein n=1 Tax=Cardiocondyla obscurior TaxID=286306 RepID=A0AAW2F7A1_9HYME